MANKREIPSEAPISEGTCLNISAIDSHNIPQYCTTETPGGIDCGADAEWVVCVVASPVCYILGS